MTRRKASSKKSGRLTREALVAANINPSTFLATDYLNHFNEVIMLLDMLPDMPDMIDEVLAWHPKTYTRHFADSGFAGKALAIRAFDAAPERIRKRFDHVVAEIDCLLIETLARLDIARQANQDLSLIVGEATIALHPLIETASSVINGTDTPAVEHHMDDAQSAVDALFAEA